jgi:hypothetical protein
MGLIDWVKGDAAELGSTNRVRRATECVPGSGNMWSAYTHLLKVHKGEESKDVETVPGE